MLKSNDNVAKIRRAVIDGYSWSVFPHEEEDGDKDLFVIQNPDYQEPDGDRNLVCTTKEFVND